MNEIERGSGEAFILSLKRSKKQFIITVVAFFTTLTIAMISIQFGEELQELTSLTIALSTVIPIFLFALTLEKAIILGYMLIGLH